MRPALVERKELLEQITQLLLHSGFYTSERINSPMFDLVARRDELFLRIKVFIYVDALYKNVALGMRLLAKLLCALPLLVCTRSMDKLRDGIVHSRHVVPIVSIHMVCDILPENSFHLAYAAGGGFYARIKGEIVWEARNKRSLASAYWYRSCTKK